MAKFCPECGAKCNEGQKFCTECGTKLAVGNVAEVKNCDNTPAPSPESAPAPIASPAPKSQNVLRSKEFIELRNSIEVAMKDENMFLLEGYLEDLECCKDQSGYSYYYYMLKAVLEPSEYPKAEERESSDCIFWGVVAELLTFCVCGYPSHLILSPNFSDDDKDASKKELLLYLLGDGFKKYEDDISITLMLTGRVPILKGVYEPFSRAMAYYINRDNIGWRGDLQWYLNQIISKIDCQHREQIQWDGSDDDGFVHTKKFDVIKFVDDLNAANYDSSESENNEEEELEDYEEEEFESYEDEESESYEDEEYDNYDEEKTDDVEPKKDSKNMLGTMKKLFRF